MTYPDRWPGQDDTQVTLRPVPPPPPPPHPHTPPPPHPPRHTPHPPPPGSIALVQARHLLALCRAALADDAARDPHPPGCRAHRRCREGHLPREVRKSIGLRD